MNKVIVLVLLVFSSISFSQNNTGQIQPTIMVIPYTKSGENALTLYEEEDKPYKAIVASINNALGSKHFIPKDLQESINQVKKNKAINSFKDINFNLEQEILNDSRPDILIKASIDIKPENGGNIVKIILQAIEVSSRGVLASLPEIETPSFATTNYGYLVTRLLKENNALEGFIISLNSSFAETIENGFKITIIIESPNESVYKLKNEVGDNFDTLSDLIIKWLKSNANKNLYGRISSSENVLKFDEYRIPLKDENNENFDITGFEIKLRKSIRTLLKEIDGKGAQFTPIINEGTIKIILP